MTCDLAGSPVGVPDLEPEQPPAGQPRDAAADQVEILVIGGIGRYSYTSFIFYTYQTIYTSHDNPGAVAHTRLIATQQISRVGLPLTV